MTHIELLTLLVKKIPRLTREEGEILKSIVSKIADKDNSIFNFYEEVSTSDGIMSLYKMKKLSEKYSVPELYKGHIDSRFDNFRKNLRIVTSRNTELKRLVRPLALDPDKWTKNKLRMFSSTEKMVIDEAGGLSNICDSIHNVGYFDYLRKLFADAATEVSRLKYTSLMQNNRDVIEYKDGK